MEAPSFKAPNLVNAWAVSVFKGDVYVTGYADEVVGSLDNSFVFGNGKVCACARACVRARECVR